MSYYVKKQNMIYENFKNIVLYPTPTNLSYYWNFGFLAGIVLGNQIITGFLLVLWYIPHIELAFNSIDFIIREVNYGWLIKSLHANGASFFFVVVYLHMIRNMYYGSYNYPREKIWYSGVILFVLLILTAFLGYVLPWGQMSYWAATVISSLISTVPVLGDYLLIYIWGGLVINQATLTRIFGLHYLLPFVLLCITMIHIILLHNPGSSNPLSINSSGDKIPFHPYFIIKDYYSFIVFMVIFCIFVFFYPDTLGHTDNYILANPGVTPLHIVPEWYFLPFYGILRSIPSKIGGVLLLVLALLLLLLLPNLGYGNIISSGFFRSNFEKIFGLFIMSFILLGWSGGKPLEAPYIYICQITTIYYFVFLIILVPLSSYIDILFFNNLVKELKKEKLFGLEFLEKRGKIKSTLIKEVKMRSVRLQKIVNLIEIVKMEIGELVKERSKDKFLEKFWVLDKRVNSWLDEKTTQKIKEIKTKINNWRGLEKNKDKGVLKVKISEIGTKKKEKIKKENNE